MKFTIAARTYNHKSNGAIALHKLADSINRLGHQACVLFFLGHGKETTWHHSVNPNHFHADFIYYNQFKSSKELENFILDSVVVYPEIITGNPLKSPKVVRYFLNREGFIKKGVPIHPGKNDFFLSWSHLYHEDPNHILRFDDKFLFTDFKVLPLSNRQIDCSYIGKGSKYGTCTPIPNTIEITRTWPQNKSDYEDLLKKTRFLYTRDSATAVIADAINFGALPIIMQYAPFDQISINKELELYSKGHKLPNLSTHDINEIKILERDFEIFRINYIEGVNNSASKIMKNIDDLIGKINKHFG
jgi:hypothetical protein